MRDFVGASVGASVGPSVGPSVGRSSGSHIASPQESSRLVGVSLLFCVYSRNALKN
jgi:hypothetical protein